MSRISTINLTTLRDTLHNMHPDAGRDADYARGILVGVVGGLMATGLSWAEAMKVVSENAPKTVVAGCVPQSWFGAFGLTEAVADGRREWERSEGR